MIGEDHDGEPGHKCVKTGVVSVVGAHHVNGVAYMHTEIVKRDTFTNLYKWAMANGETSKFVNCTNGVTPRRWINCANPGLSKLITEKLGSDAWLKDLSLIKGICKFKDDKAFQTKWMAIKQSNKERFAKWIKKHCGLDVDASYLFDVQVKRIHEYKRQLMNVFYQIFRYLEIKDMSPGDRAKLQKRFSCIGGKAAPGYYRAKSIIKLINNVSTVINNDPDVSPYLKFVFLPNYNVSAAQTIIPASETSQHISTAGTEASGTSNMKFVMNGGLIVGTMDGANVEIRRDCGDDTIFIFGALEEQCAAIRARAQQGNYPIDPRLRRAFQQIKDGRFSLGCEKANREFNELIDKLCNIHAAGTWEGDRYLVINDFPSFVDAQARVDQTYADKATWCKLSIQAASSMAKFSTDRTISEYASTIWGVTPAPRPVATAQSSPTGYTSAKLPAKMPSEKLPAKMPSEKLTSLPSEKL